MARAAPRSSRRPFMDLEFLLRKKPVWRKTLQGILFKPGDIVERGEEAEQV